MFMHIIYCSAINSSLVITFLLWLIGYKWFKFITTAIILYHSTYIFHFFIQHFRPLRCFHVFSVFHCGYFWKSGNKNEILGGEKNWFLLNLLGAVGLSFYTVCLSFCTLFMCVFNNKLYLCHFPHFSNKTKNVLKKFKKKVCLF